MSSDPCAPLHRLQVFSVIRWCGHLELLDMERGVDDPPVLGPFLAVVAAQAVVEQPLKPAELELLEVAELVGQDLAHQLGLRDGHPWHRPEPGYGRFTCHCQEPFSVMMPVSAGSLHSCATIMFGFLWGTAVADIGERSGTTDSDRRSVE